MGIEGAQHFYLEIRWQKVLTCLELTFEKSSPIIISGIPDYFKYHHLIMTFNLLEMPVIKSLANGIELHHWI